MNDGIKIRYNDCKICGKETLVVELYEEDNIVVCFDCLLKLFYAWDEKDCEKLEIIGTPEDIRSR